MASNEIQMKEFSEGSTGTGDRVRELMFPVDISHRSQQAEANGKKSDLELNLQKENFGAGPSGGSSEDDELVHPVPESRSEAEVEGQGRRRVTFLEPIREEDPDDAVRTHQPAGDSENMNTTDHTVTVTVEESEEYDRMCRTCGPDEEIAEPDNLLEKLGCHCRGDLSRMHRKCILEWYGPRICQQNNYKCELCNAVLHGRIERIVFRALLGQDSGNDILIKAMRIPAPRFSHRRSRTRRVAPGGEAPTQGNAPTDSHQIDIAEVAQPDSQQPRHPGIWQWAQNWLENHPSQGSFRGGYPMCMVFFIILVLIALGAARVGKV